MAPADHPIDRLQGDHHLAAPTFHPADAVLDSARARQRDQRLYGRQLFDDGAHEAQQFVDLVEPDRHPRRHISPAVQVAICTSSRS